MRKKQAKKAVLIAAALSAVGVAGTLVGCVHRSGGTWMMKSASLPEGWPELTPIGEVEIRRYPTYRAASVADVQLEGDGMTPMFMELFRHINRNDIAMTAPVDMGYTLPRDGDASPPRMASMAFLYRTTDIGTTGNDGPIRIEDLPPATFASVGVRGGYTDERFRDGLDEVNGWLEGNTEWQVTGEPRFLGYNSPFVPSFMRYGEVQVPVEAR